MLFSTDFQKIRTSRRNRARENTSWNLSECTRKTSNKNWINVSIYCKFAVTSRVNFVCKSASHDFYDTELARMGKLVDQQSWSGPSCMYSKQRHLKN